jgi:hypothetical protein
MADGVTVRIRTEGADLEGMIERLRDHRPAYESLTGLLTRAESYEGQRFSGVGTMPHGGPRKGPRERRDNDSVGYAPHVGVSRTKRLLRVTSTRIDLPPLADDIDERVAEAMAEYVMGATAPAEEVES